MADTSERSALDTGRPDLTIRLDNDREDLWQRIDSLTTSECMLILNWIGVYSRESMEKALAYVQKTRDMIDERYRVRTPTSE